ncbi:MAG TPA: hypothetical protein VEV61_13695 [Streptosporangiaceae bacterium]|nr:hypothetical protein [Streptosporangiaceae bacterium]
MSTGARATGPTEQTGASAGSTTTTTTARQSDPYRTGGYEQGAAQAGYGYEQRYEAREQENMHLGGVMLLAAGLLTFFAGLSATVRHNFYHANGLYAYAWSARSWGIALLCLGAVTLLVGACALLGMTWAKWVGVGLAILTMIGAFMFLVYSPVWAVILIALSAIAVWGLLRGETV